MRKTQPEEGELSNFLLPWEPLTLLPLLWLRPPTPPHTAQSWKDLPEKGGVQRRTPLAWSLRFRSHWPGGPGRAAGDATFAATKLGLTQRRG